MLDLLAPSPTNSAFGVPVKVKKSVEPTMICGSSGVKLPMIPDLMFFCQMPDAVWLARSRALVKSGFAI